MRPRKAVPLSSFDAKQRKKQTSRTCLRDFIGIGSSARRTRRKFSVRLTMPSNVLKVSVRSLSSDW